MGFSWEAVGAVILPHIGGIAGGLITRKEVKTWYQEIKKPSFTPPDRIFGPVWTTLYTGMGYASYLVWRDGGGFSGAAKLPLTLYASQLALNWAWTPIFFGAHSIKWGAVEIVALTSTAAAAAITMGEVNKTAGLIMVPYMCWLSYATVLNITTYFLNKDEKKAVKKD